MVGPQGVFTRTVAPLAWPLAEPVAGPSSWLKAVVRTGRLEPPHSGRLPAPCRSEPAERGVSMSRSIHYFR